MATNKLKHIRMALKDYGLFYLFRKALTKPSLIKNFLARPVYSTYSFEKEVPDEVAINFIKSITEAQEKLITKYLEEIKTDADFVNDINEKFSWTKARPNNLHRSWREVIYAIIRIEKPEKVIEAGTYDGLASAYILRAMERNDCGHLFGIDLNLRTIMPVDMPDVQSGWIIPSHLKNRWTFIEGDAGNTIEKILNKHNVEIILSDTGRKSQDREFSIYTEKLSKGALIFRSSPVALSKDIYPPTQKTAVLYKGDKAGYLTAFRS